MKRKIIGFDKDAENDWRAALDCGHLQHVRHKPPLVSREWVLTKPLCTGSAEVSIGLKVRFQSLLKDERIIILI